METTISKKIHPSEFQSLLWKAVSNYGLPSCYEEIAIYIENENPDEFTRVIIHSTAEARLVTGSKRDQQVITIPFKGEDVKKVLSFLSHGKSLRGVISVSPVYEFKDYLSGEKIRMLKTSLHGPVVIFSSKDNENDLGKFGKNTETDIHSGDKETEIIIDHTVSPSGILNTKILTFLEKNGIPLSYNRKVSYRETMMNRSNNYENYEDLFKAITGLELTGKEILSKDNIDWFNTSATKISVIIPCFNSEESILSVLNSLSKQKMGISFENVEVVLVDDCSIVSVKEIVGKNTYPFKLNIIRLEKNAGASTARHLGSTYASSSILIFLDSDIMVPFNYVNEHLVRNLITPNAVFVSFKQNVPKSDKINLDVVPNYSHDLRVHKVVHKDAIGSYDVSADTQVEILETTNYFKSFSGSRVFGIYDLSCMVVGHNFSIRKKTLHNSKPFSRDFMGWGMEDVFLGLKIICNGNYIIPVMSTGVYHVDHPPRSGSEDIKKEQYKKNTEKINSFLDSFVEDENA